VPAAVQCACLREHLLRIQVFPGEDPGLALRDAVEARTRDRLARDSARADRRGDLQRGPLVQGRE
jgi:hypothetical protein